MKIIKTLMVLVALFIATTCFGCNTINNHEIWKNKKVTYTFVDDSLYIDELGNEGDCYTYELIGNCLYLTDELGYPSAKIVIVKMTKKHVWLLVQVCDFNNEKSKIIKFKRYGCDC